MRDVHRQNLQ